MAIYLKIDFTKLKLEKKKFKRTCTVDWGTSVGGWTTGSVVVGCDGGGKVTGATCGGS